MQMKGCLRTRPRRQIRIIPLETETLLANFGLDVFSPTFPRKDLLFAFHVPRGMHR